MSIYDRRGAGTTIKVWVEKDGVDDLGNPRRRPATAEPVLVHGTMRPGSSTEGDGDAVSSFYTFRGRTFPANAHGKVEWDGRTWQIVGEPARRSGSPTTAHVTVTLRALDARTVDA